MSMGILQARILKWVSISSSRGSSQHRDQTQFSHIVSRFFTIWATREAPRPNIKDQKVSGSLIPGTLCPIYKIVGIIFPFCTLCNYPAHESYLHTTFWGFTHPHQWPTLLAMDCVSPKATCDFWDGSHSVCGVCFPLNKSVTESQYSKSMPQPVMLKKLKLRNSMKKHKTF